MLTKAEDMAGGLDTSCVCLSPSADMVLARGGGCEINSSRAATGCTFSSQVARTVMVSRLQLRVAVDSGHAALGGWFVDISRRGSVSQGLPVGTEGNREGLRRRSWLRFAASALRLFSSRML